MTSEFLLARGRMETSRASVGTEERKHTMRYLEKLSKGVALDSSKPSPAEVLSVLSHCLPSLYRYAYRVLGNKADAEDAVQDALVAAFEHLNRFRGDAQLSPAGSMFSRR